MGRIHAAVLLYGVANAVLYANLLPLWDGFDEPFHFAYVEHLEEYRRPPIWGQTHTSLQVYRSLKLAPEGELVRQNIPDVMTFEQYFRLSQSDRRAVRERLNQVSGREESGGLNYEAQQAPLAYAMLAAADPRSRPLLARVLRLRLLGAVVAAVTTGLGALMLLWLLGTPADYQALALFLVFSSQSFYLATAHVSNDWLAMPLFSWLCVAGVALWTKPTVRRACLFALVLSAGLLTKAYFLALLPFAAVIAARLPRRAFWSFVAILAAVGAPWYIRNVVVVDNLVGMQETAGGVHLRELWRAAISVPWPRSILASAHSVMWTGNNSGTAFSAKTVDVMLLAGLLLLAIYIWRGIRHGVPAEQRAVALALLCYGMGLAAYTVLAFRSTHAVGIGPEPWYVAVALPPFYCLLLHRPVNRFLVAAIAWLWAYVILATYVVKLIPFYGGRTAAHAHVGELLDWYRAAWRARFDVLGTTALGPLAVILPLAALVVMAAIGLAGYLTWRLCLHPRADGTEPLVDGVRT